MRFRRALETDHRVFGVVTSLVLSGKPGRIAPPGCPRGDDTDVIVGELGLHPVTSNLPRASGRASGLTDRGTLGALR
jgi:hypothetical protein